MNTDRDTLADLRRLDPAAQIPDGPLDAREKAVLARVLAQPKRAARPTPRGRSPMARRRALVLAAGVAVAASAVVVTGLPLPSQHSGIAYAATPPLLPFELNPGNPAATDAIRTAAAASASTLWAERAATEIIRGEDWSLSTRVDNKTIHSGPADSTR